MDFYNQSLVIEREIGNRTGEAQTLYQIGIVYQKTNRFEQAMGYYYKEAIGLFDVLKDKERAAVVKGEYK